MKDTGLRSCEGTQVLGHVKDTGLRSCEGTQVLGHVKGHRS